MTQYSLGIFYGSSDPDTEMLAKKFAGHLINDEEFCKACEDLEENIKCDKCRENLKSYSNSIYFFEQVGQNVPAFIEEPQNFLPENLPKVDFLLVVGIHPDLLSGIPEYASESGIPAVIVPIEDPQWVPPGLQVQVLEEFEKYDVQASLPKPFCSLNVEEDEYNKVGFNLTEKHDLIKDFIHYFQIGRPKVSFLVNKHGDWIEDSCVLRSAPCGSTYYIVQQLEGKYYKNGKQKGEESLNEKISGAHHAYPCNASMDQDTILKDSILHVGGYLVRNAIRKELGLKTEESIKLKYIIK
ncbi:MAG: DUF166 domain-containing protein [Promethearchaeia archaeon]